MERGELSYSKVRARVASAPTEGLLLSIALHGTAHHVETTVRCFRRAQQTEELSREARQQAARRLTWSYDEDGPSFAVETARRLGCDASVVAVLEDENGKPLNVGRKMRTIPPAIRRALQVRDKCGCRFPGCTNKHYVDGHHIRHWGNGGETRLSNLVLLCRFHHRQVHEGGVTIQALDDGALRFTVKDGRSFDSLAPARHAADGGRSSQDVTRGNWFQLVDDSSESGIAITPRTAVTRWRGERMDYGTAMDALLYRARRATLPDRVSAETRAVA